jgi:hypothetical protein
MVNHNHRANTIPVIPDYVRKFKVVSFALLLLFWPNARYGGVRRSGYFKAFHSFISGSLLNCAAVQNLNLKSLCGV